MYQLYLCFGIVVTLKTRYVITNTICIQSTNTLQQSVYTIINNTAYALVWHGQPFAQRERIW